MSGGIVEGGVVAVEEFAGKDSVHCCVLDVDVKGGAGHGDSYVEVDLEGVADGGVDVEGLGFGAGEVGEEFRGCEKEG